MIAAGSIDFGRWDVDALARAWSAATPFQHAVIDGAVTDDQLDALRTAVGQEPHLPERSEIVDGMGSAETMQHPTLQAFAASLGSAAGLSTVHAITGRAVTRVEARSYIYLRGGYLLPHTDHRLDIGRRVAWAAYLSPPGTCTGGELELFRCTLDGRTIVATEPACRIEHRANRLVMFEVSDASLHQIREVTDGARVSLAGWFF